MLNRRTKIYVMVLIWGAIILQLFINGKVNRESRLVEQVMSQDMENVVFGSVKAYAYYGDEYMTIKNMEAMANNMAKRLGINSDISIETKEEGNKKVTTLNKYGKVGNTKINVISINKVGEDGKNYVENYLLTQIDLKEIAGTKAYTLKKNLTKIYEALGLYPNTNIYICSQCKGKMTDEEIDGQVELFLNEMDAAKIEKISFDNVVCVYGYCRNIDEYVYQGNKRVNVNIAFSYNEDEDVTYIHRAIPFVDKSF